MTHPLIQFALDFYQGKYSGTAYEFAVEFIHRRYANNVPEKGLEGEVIGSLFLDCDRFEPDEPNAKNGEIDEAQFRTELENHLKRLRLI